jgi:hypothetical protein
MSVLGALPHRGGSLHSAHDAAARGTVRPHHTLLRVYDAEQGQPRAREARVHRAQDGDSQLGSGLAPRPLSPPGAQTAEVDRRNPKERSDVAPGDARVQVRVLSQERCVALCRIET